MDALNDVTLPVAGKGDDAFEAQDVRAIGLGDLLDPGEETIRVHFTAAKRDRLHRHIMGIAIITTLFLAQPSIGGFLLIVAGLAIGGGAGAYIAKRIPMTAMPQLVAGFHSLVGLAAVLVAAAALYAPSSFGIGDVGSIPTQALVEMALGVAIGAITFTGSIIAFLKLDGRMSGKPILLPYRHAINLALAALVVFFIIGLALSESHFDFWAIVALSLALGVLIIVPIGGADM